MAAFAFLLAPTGSANSMAAQSPGEGDRDEALRILQAASERYEGVQAFCGSFEQEMNVVLLNQVTESHGLLCQARPDRFLMQFHQPAGDVVVADGTHLWVYFPSTDPGQAFRSDLAASEGRFDFHREFLDDPGQKYEPEYRGEEEMEGRTAHVIHLTPLEPSPYQEATVWIDGQESLIRKVRIVEENESVRTVVLRDLELEPEISDDLFEFTPPSGVQVIVR